MSHYFKIRSSRSSNFEILNFPKSARKRHIWTAELASFKMRSKSALFVGRIAIFPAVSGSKTGRKWMNGNPALNVNFSILGSVLDPVLGSVLDPVLGSVLDPVLGPKSAYLLKVRAYRSPVDLPTQLCPIPSRCKGNLLDLFCPLWSFRDLLGLFGTFWGVPFGIFGTKLGCSLMDTACNNLVDAA